MHLRLSLPVAIIIAAAMVCATLLALNLRTTYTLDDLFGRDKSGGVYIQLLGRGCTIIYGPGDPSVAARLGVSCPLWVRP